MNRIDRYFLLILVILIHGLCLAQNEHPKREFRAAWIASVVNLDWPTTYANAQQRADLINMLDELDAIGINVIIFQVRPECDALYQSELEPWSYWLTGEQGRAPNPFYDPLEFALEESHKRGMELHAWFNPYRAQRSIISYPLAANHIANLHPEWTFLKGNLRMLDPGLPMIREFVTNVVMDVVTRYDVDGVHFDDYFYPYEGMNTADDQETYNNYSRGILNRADWRRDNVNLLVEMVYDSIQVVAPNVKFGISPFGIWRNGVPSGITGLSAYDFIYCDAVTWLSEHNIDYIMPQLYWQFGGSQDYGLLLPWWASQTNGRHLYSGNAAYRIIDHNWPVSEVINQLNFNRETSNCYGEAYFRAGQGLINNPKGLADSLKNNYYQYPALLPQMSWKDQVEPNQPSNLRYEPIAENGPATLQWDLPSIASDGDSASRYVIYNFNDPDIMPEDLQETSNILAVTGNRSYSPQTAVGGYFAVTALDRNYNESIMSNAITVAAPGVPVLAGPVNGASNQRDTLVFSWFTEPLVASYQVQISPDSNFISILYDISNVADTSLIVNGFVGQLTYYWRVAAANAGGQSPFSNKFSFNTGFPAVPQLVSPLHASLEVPLDTSLNWQQGMAVDEYRIQLAYARSFTESLLILDTTITQDTSLSVFALEEFSTHFWRVKAGNAYGPSDWSDIWGFKTIAVSGLESEEITPVLFTLSQNYPNPFNPLTTIEFSLSVPGQTNLEIYDMQGRLVGSLIDQYMNRGAYSWKYDGSNLASGVYICRLISNRRQLTRKMIIMK